jgi:hypothetical protein
VYTVLGGSQPSQQVSRITQLKIMSTMECTFPRTRLFSSTLGKQLIEHGNLSSDYLLQILSAITRDEKLHRDPELFLPERYLPEPEGFGELPSEAVFGYGRRSGEFILFECPILTTSITIQGLPWTSPSNEQSVDSRGFLDSSF